MSNEILRITDQDNYQLVLEMKMGLPNIIISYEDEDGSGIYVRFCPLDEQLEEIRAGLETMKAWCN